MIPRAWAALDPPAVDVEREALEALDRNDPRAALALLMDAYGAPVYRFCRRTVGDEELARDVHQTTFVQAFEGLARFSRRSSVRTWLFSIARHRCLDALKVGRRRQRRFEPMALDADEPDAEVRYDDAGAEERLISSQRSISLRRCLERLAPAARTAVLLRFQEDLSYPEIARISGERPPTLQARVARALPVLRRCLEGPEAAA
jgi:RNA polymerase sigma-70 factor (ECF subfamily)